ncbi:MAG: RodZ domain-containing protein [Lysobacter sp.]
MGQSNEIGASDIDSCGARLARARENAGITLEEASTRLKMPVRVVRSLENDEWGSGATVFVRGQLRSYARLLGVDIEQDLVRAGVSEVRPAELVSHTHTPRYQRMFEQAARRGVYIAITAVIVVPVWLATRPHLAITPEVQSLDVPMAAASAVDPPVQSNGASGQRTPITASMAALRAPAVAIDAPGILLTFNDDSWLQVTGADGKVVEEAVLGKDSTRQFNANGGLQIVIGNAAAVQASHEGKAVDLTAFSRANVARFKLSSDGSLAPTSD